MKIFARAVTYHLTDTGLQGILQVSLPEWSSYSCRYIIGGNGIINDFQNGKG